MGTILSLTLLLLLQDIEPVFYLHLIFKTTVFIGVFERKECTHYQCIIRFLPFLTIKNAPIFLFL